MSLQYSQDAGTNMGMAFGSPQEWLPMQNAVNTRRINESDLMLGQSQLDWVAAKTRGKPFSNHFNLLLQADKDAFPTFSAVVVELMPAAQHV